MPHALPYSSAFSEVQKDTQGGTQPDQSTTCHRAFAFSKETWGTSPAGVILCASSPTLQSTLDLTSSLGALWASLGQQLLLLVPNVAVPVPSTSGS